MCASLVLYGISHTIERYRLEKDGMTYCRLVTSTLYDMIVPSLQSLSHFLLKNKDQAVRFFKDCLFSRGDNTFPFQSISPLKSVKYQSIYSTVLQEVL